MWSGWAGADFCGTGTLNEAWIGVGRPLDGRPVFVRVCWVFVFRRVGFGRRGILVKLGIFDGVERERLVGRRRSFDRVGYLVQRLGVGKVRFFGSRAFIPVVGEGVHRGRVAREAIQHTASECGSKVGLRHFLVVWRIGHRGLSG